MASRPRSCSCRCPSRASSGGRAPSSARVLISSLLGCWRTSTLTIRACAWGASSLWLYIRRQIFLVLAFFPHPSASLSLSHASYSLFDLGEFGVPVALIGMAYILVASPFLLPGGRRKGEAALPMDDDGTILLGARLTQWSPAANRTVKRSGLRDTGGIYLVSVYRARSGNIHRGMCQPYATMSLVRAS